MTQRLQPKCTSPHCWNVGRRLCDKCKRTQQLSLATSRTERDRKVHPIQVIFSEVQQRFKECLEEIARLSAENHRQSLEITQLRRENKDLHRSKDREVEISASLSNGKSELEIRVREQEREIANLREALRVSEEAHNRTLAGIASE